MFSMRPYQGSPENPFPPMPGCWSVVGWHDQVAMARAVQLAAEMPVWNYLDEVTSQGCYRYFCAQAQDGTQGVCALKMRPAGTPGTLGDAAAGGDGSGDGGDTSGNTSGTSTQQENATTDTTQGAVSGDTTNVDAGPSGGGGSVSPSTPATPVNPSPSVPTTTTSSSSSTSPWLWGGLAALAIGGVVVVGAAAKKKGKGAHRR